MQGIGLSGEYSHSIDEKGRLIFPVKLREKLGERFVICKGLGDKCLYGYSFEEWSKLEDKIKALPIVKSRELQRFIFSSAAEAVPDKQGRINIPQTLREFSGLNKDVVIIGASTRVEIWSRDNWESVSAEMTDKQILDTMIELGF